MTDDVQVPPAGRTLLYAEMVGDIWSDITAKVTEKAVDSINKAIKDQLGDVGGAILGPVVKMGMSALVGALGLDGGKSESDLDKVMGELAKIKDTLAQLQGQLRKIESAVKEVGELVSREAERINQAAKYRDYLDAREAIDAMWTTSWSLIAGIAAAPEDRDAVRSARSLYTTQTVDFIRDTLAAVGKLHNSVLKMFGDRESLFLHMASESQPTVREAIHTQVAARINADGFTLLQRKKPEVWKALLDGPCGDVLRNMDAYTGKGLDGRSGTLQRFWYGESWVIFMETARAAIVKQISASPMTIFMAEVNMAFARALIILTIIYGRNTGLAVAANKVLATLDDVAAEANRRYAEFINSLVGWVGDVGEWGISPIGRRPVADPTKLFGLWAANWMDTSTDFPYPCSYTTDAQGKSYPCSLATNFPDVRTVAERIWRNPTAMTFVYEKKGTHEFGCRYQGFAEFGPPLDKWTRQHIDALLPMVQTYPALPAV